MSTRAPAPGTVFVTTPPTVRFGSPVLAAAGVPAQARVLVSDQLVPALRTAYLRAAPLVVDARGRVQNTVDVRVIPAFRTAGDRLGPVLTAATLRAGATARTAGTTLNAHAQPVTAEAARRGRNTLAALLGSDPVPAPAAGSRGRVLRWLVVAGAVAGASYGAWQVRTRRIDTPRPDTAGTPAMDPDEVIRVVAEMPAPLPDPAATSVEAVEPGGDELKDRLDRIEGDPGSAPPIS